MLNSIECIQMWMKFEQNINFGDILQNHHYGTLIQILTSLFLLFTEIRQQNQFNCNFSKEILTTK